jgi:two-component SAPR family response regulator
MSESPAASPLILLAWKGIEAMMYPNSVMAYERSLQVVSEGLRIAEKSGIHILDPTLFAQGIYTSFSLGDMAMASEFLQKLGASLMGGQRNTIGQYHFITAWYNLLLGNVSTSLMHAEKALNLVSESGTPFPEFLCRLLMAQVLHETKKYEQALTHLSIAGEIIHRLGTSMFEVVYQLFSAQFAMDKGEEKDCLESLSKAMTLGKKQEFKTIVFIWRKPVMSRLCAKALEAGIEVDYVSDLIRTLKLIPDSSSLEIETWPYPLKIYTLGRFEIVKDGEALRFSGKGQKKPVEMLKAIIAFGGRDVNEDQLMDCLWPEAAGDTANLSFRTTLHRLRKLAGCEEAIQCGERRLALDPRFCWMDVMAFQRMTKKIEDIWKEKRPEDFNHIIDLSEKAAGLYKGDFLSADAALPWTYTTRERLRNRYVRLVKRMGRCCEETGQGERALECYQKALEADNLQEEFYRAIMLCYEKMGNHTDALRTYDRCRTALQTILGVEPSPETEELHRRLRRL